MAFREGPDDSLVGAVAKSKYTYIVLGAILILIIVKMISG